MKTHCVPSILMVSHLAALALVTAAHCDDQTLLPNVDKRRDHLGPSVWLDLQREHALANLRARIPGLKVEFDEILVSPKFVFNEQGFLSGPASEEEILNPRTATQFPMVEPNDPHQPIKRFLDENAELFGYDASILAPARISREFVTAHSGMRTVVWEQQLDGIPIFEAVLYGHITKNGELVSVCSQFVPAPARAADAGMANRTAILSSPPVSPEQAVASAAINIDETVDVQAVRAVGPAVVGAERRQSFQASAVRGEATASLVWLPMDRDTMRLCWRVTLTGQTRGELFQVLVDALTGEPQVRHCWTFRASSASYLVFTGESPSPKSPGWSEPSAEQPPVLGDPPLYSRQLVTLSSLSPVASPNGWINDGLNETIGNNADARLDLDGDDFLDLPIERRPQGNPSRVFEFSLDLGQSQFIPNPTGPPIPNQDSAVVNAFYWCNWMHDRLYDLGFTEAAGNFQQDNFGRGGVGGDALVVDVQNAALATLPGYSAGSFSDAPTDGSPARLEMFLWNGPSPYRDGALDAFLILHEYTHGLSQRLVGFASTLAALQTKGLAEGWSDFFPLALLGKPTNELSGTYQVFPYATYLWTNNGVILTENYYYGARRYPYSTDMSKSPLTFLAIDLDQAESISRPECPPGTPVPLS